jgi:hypothetical protein
MNYNKFFDFLSIIHFFWFYLLGKIIKNNYLFAFILGIIWEILEYFITKYPFTRNLLIKYWLIPKKIWDEDAFNINRVSDILFNMLGYHFGTKNYLNVKF